MRFPTSRLARLLLGGFAAALAVPTHAQPSAVKQRHAYDSRYLVFGTKTGSDTPRLLAIDLNRTVRGPDRVTYEGRGMYEWVRGSAERCSASWN